MQEQQSGQNEQGTEPASSAKGLVGEAMASLAGFPLTLVFFTRLPIPLSEAQKDRQLGQTALAFPFVGLVIGAIVAAVWALACLVLPPLPAAGLAMGASMLLTGALHEDGLSDIADGLGGGASRERALEIMRDSRIGAYGAAALVMSIGLRWTLLASLSPLAGCLALVISHMCGRSAITLAMTLASYARETGLGKSVSNTISQSLCVLTLVVTLLLALILGQIAGMIASLIGFACAYIFLLRMKKRIGGYTGDGLGAMEQICEIATLASLAAFWSL